MGVLSSQDRACDDVAMRHARRAAGAIIGCQRSIAKVGLGCPVLHHEIEDTLAMLYGVTMYKNKVGNKG